MRTIASLVFFFTAANMAAQPVANGSRNNGPPPVRERGPLDGPGGKWWDRPEVARRLDLTAEQQKKMDEVFQQSRLRLIDLHAALEKEEVVMEGLMNATQLDDSKILPAVDRIAQARADLEKVEARLMLGLRHILTAQQWQRLNEDGRPPRGGPPPRDGRPPRQEPPPPRQD